MLLRIAVYIGLIFVIDYYFLRFICPLCKKASKSIKTGWYKLIFSSVIFMITIIVSSVFPVKLTSFADSGFVTFLFLSIAIFAAYPIIFSNIKNMAEAAAKKEMEQQNKLLLLQIEKENLKMAQDRMLRHDRRHHNLVLLNFANNNDTESIKEYLKKLTENDVDNTGGVTYCKNLTINTVLSAYERLAGDEGISVKISADAGFDLPVSPQDLVIVIANLFENAIYATSKIGLRDKIIDIDIRHKESRLFIKIENPCKANLEFDETDYGIGINSVINTVEKYDGMYDFSVEDGIFSSKICLNF